MKHAPCAAQLLTAKAKFQGLEIHAENFPMIGKHWTGISSDWS
jgi:hypothetical protein